MNGLEHYITLALEKAGQTISADMRFEIANLEREIIRQAVTEAIQRVAAGEGKP